MIPAVTIKTIEFEELNRQIEGLQADLKVKARKAGLLAMAQPLSKEIRGTTPVKSGALHSSIGHQWLKDAEVAVRVGSVRRVTTGALLRANGGGFSLQSRRRMQYYKMLFLEEGTKPHEIKARKGGLIWIHGKPRGQSVMHPGVRAHWIQRNAFNQQQPQFLERFTSGAARALAKYGVKSA